MKAPVYLLKPGATGYLVNVVQGRMGAAQTGVLGKEVADYQRAHGLTPDGIVGPATFNALGMAVELGVDVHGGKGAVDWGKVAAFGVKHASLKSTEGVTFNDAHFTANCNGAKAAGLSARAYHFARPSNPVADEVAHALRVAGTVPLDLDLEGTGGLSAADLGKWTVAFLRAVEAAQRQTPHLYVNEDYWLNRLDKAARVEIAAHFRLWIAAPGRASPQLCFPHWDAHQFSWAGDVPGIAGDVDLDWVVVS